MSERERYQQGVPCWADLTTSDPEAGRAFYGALFGWDWQVTSDPQFGDYATALLRDKRVVGLAGRADDSQPIAWTTYFAVDDADKTAATLTAAGGSLAYPVMDIGPQGRTTLAGDPTGAAFGLWQAAAHTGSQLVNEPGTVVWNELLTGDLDGATAFYTAVLGVDWSDEMSDPAMPYKLLQVDGRTAGGAMQLTADMAGIPPHWAVYFEVADTAATVAKAQELGATVVAPVTPTPQGPMARLADPQGGMFALIASGSTV